MKTLGNLREPKEPLEILGKPMETYGNLRKFMKT